MERRMGAIGQLFSDPAGEWKEVVCPQPVRPSSRFYCKPKGLSVHTEMDILDFILNQDDQDCAGYFCDSPPVRSSNPVIRDAAFGNVGLPMLSPLSGSGSSGMNSPMVERGGSPCGSSSSGSPQIRIEGFLSGSSDLRSVLSALA